jgi:hypothetical protein
MAGKKNEEIEAELFRFNITGLITRDRKETVVLKGEKKLIVASLDGMKVVLKQIKGLATLSENLQDEMLRFFFIVHPGIATCLGYACWDCEYFLVFHYSMFTVDDWLDSRRRFYHERIIAGQPSDDDLHYEVSYVFEEILNIINELYVRGMCFNTLNLNDIFIDQDGKNPEIYNLEDLTIENKNPNQVENLSVKLYYDMLGEKVTFNEIPILISEIRKKFQEN